MKAVAAGIVSAFIYSLVLWAIARMQGLNADPLEAGVMKGIFHAFLIALPVGVVAHTIIAFFQLRIFWMIPAALGIAMLVAALFAVTDSSVGQYANLLGLLGLPVAFSIPYSLVVNLRPDRSVVP